MHNPIDITTVMIITGNLYVGVGTVQIGIVTGIEPPASTTTIFRGTVLAIFVIVVVHGGEGHPIVNSITIWIPSLILQQTVS